MASPATLSGATLEQQLIELVTRIQIKERDTASNPDGSNFVTGSANFDTGIFSGTFNIPITNSVDTNGNTVSTAVEYLTDG